MEVLESGTFKRRLGDGDSFGEIALIRDVPRTATVRARCECALLALDRDHFISAVTGHDRSHEAAHATAEGRFPSRAPA
jgi:CRP-like cAMP-binding protein